MPKGKVACAWINSAQADAVAEYYVQGHSVTETAECFGVTKYQVSNLAKARGLTNGRTFRTARVDDQKREAEQKLAERVAEIGFEYVGGYISRHGAVRIRCRKCGETFERTVDFLKRGNVVCVECQKAETQKRKEERRKTIEQKTEAGRITNEILRLWYPPVDTRREALMDQTGICEICGKPYVVREYVKSCGLKYARDNGVCSIDCKKEKTRRIVRESHKGRVDNHRHRAQKYGCEYDSSISLKKLVKRDGLKCALCGKMCDPNDHSWSKYSGPMYPSIDHIIPMSKGGGHTWDNVQVAHIICNSEKGDSTEEVGA